MKIDRVTLTHIRIPLIEPFRISSGEVSVKDAILVGVSAEGVTGYGEASPMEGTFYSGDTPESVWEALTNTMVPATLRGKADSIDSVNAILDGIEGSPFAKAGIETAFWDLEGQRTCKPVLELLGGQYHSLESGLAVGIYPDIKSLLASINRYMPEGYKRIKIKIEPGWDVKPLEAVRREFADFPLMVDANGAYSDEHMDHLGSLEKFGLMMIEQPFPRNRLQWHAELQNKMKTPLCLDESAEDIASLREAFALKACRIVNIKIQRVGGLKKAKNMHDMCAEAGIPVWGGTMPELGVGGAQTLHLATLANFKYPTDVESSRRWFVDDIVEPALEVRNGTLQIPVGSGNCHRIAEPVLKKYKIAEMLFKGSE
ncbi:MAG: o-succinylbenzoate synthase [Bacteroidota bacterium]